jgi:hypothetical protein
VGERTGEGEEVNASPVTRGAGVGVSLLVAGVCGSSSSPRRAVLDAVRRSFAVSVGSGEGGAGQANTAARTCFTRYTESEYFYAGPRRPTGAHEADGV